MANELATIPKAVPVLDKSLVELWLDAKRPETVRAYAADLADFARFADRPTASAALDWLFSVGANEAHGIVLTYQNSLSGRGLAPATIRRRMAALKSIARLARVLGRITWPIDLKAPKASAYRDTRGPGRDGYRRLLAAAKREPRPSHRARNVAIVRLLHDLALRRGEVTRLDLDDLAEDASAVEVLGKGRSEKQRLTIPRSLRPALLAWLDVRGRGPGPLFPRLDCDNGGRLTGRSVHKLVKRLSTKAKIPPARPHGLRHEAITRALDATGGNVREVQRFSRHAKIDTVIIYDDNRTDKAGSIAELVAED